MTTEYNETGAIRKEPVVSFPYAVFIHFRFYFTLFYFFLALFSSQLCGKIRVFVIFSIDSSIYEQELSLLYFKRKAKGFFIHTHTHIYIYIYIYNKITYCLHAQV